MNIEILFAGRYTFVSEQLLINYLQGTFFENINYLNNNVLCKAL